MFGFLGSSECFDGGCYAVESEGIDFNGIIVFKFCYREKKTFGISLMSWLTEKNHLLLPRFIEDRFVRNSDQ